MSDNNPAPVVFANLVDDPALAAEAGVTPRSTARWRNMPDGIPYIKIGRRIFYNIDSTRRWIASRERQRNPRNTRRRK